jgi:hypothetical protein
MSPPASKKSKIQNGSHSSKSAEEIEPPTIQDQVSTKLGTFLVGGGGGSRSLRNTVSEIFISLTYLGITCVN